MKCAQFGVGRLTIQFAAVGLQHVEYVVAVAAARDNVQVPVSINVSRSRAHKVIDRRDVHRRGAEGPVTVVQPQLQLNSVVAATVRQQVGLGVTVEVALRDEVTELAAVLDAIVDHDRREVHLRERWSGQLRRGL
eukprot:3736611-Prymnesium_polylepis.1